MKYGLLTILVAVLSSAAVFAMETAEPEHFGAKFEPPAGKVLVFVGQDNASVGGNGAYTNGYVDHVGVPAGITHYVYFAEGWTNKVKPPYTFDVGTVDGLNKETTWGAGPMCMKAYVDSPKLKDCVIHLSISMEGNSEDKVADGSYDHLIKELAEFCKTYNDRIFLIRIGYEFDGPWNDYDPGNFKGAFKRIVDGLREAEVTNYATVMASAGGEDIAKWHQYYPGDDYVDWVGYSYFRKKNVGRAALAFARAHKKPVFIAEATPKGLFLDKTDAEEAWGNWYATFFEHVEENRDVVRAISYINADWDSQHMWNGWGNTRVEINDGMLEKWKKEMSKTWFVNAEDKPIEMIRAEDREQARAAVKMPYLDTTLSLDERVDDLVDRLTLGEKIALCRSTSRSIDRLGIPAYQWWSESLHGATSFRSKNHPATCYPHCIAMAATWNPELIKDANSAIADEMRARHVFGGNGLTTFAPIVNVVRDPRWGRTLETFGEDPFLISMMGDAVVRGLQGDDPRYIKIAATAKHFAVHNGPETKRRIFDAEPSERDLRETYLPPFQYLIQRSRAELVMTAFNKLYGIPCTCHEWLLEELLRKEWGFTGTVVSDDHSAADIAGYHKYAPSGAKGAALAITAGCDVEVGGGSYAKLMEAYKGGFVTEETIDRACRRAMRTRFKLGQFDPQEQVPYTKIPKRVIGGENSRATALQVARESLVLLKNKDGFLPLDPGKLKKVAVIGPNADCEQTLLANYFWSTPTAMITPLTGIKTALKGKAEVVYAQGSGWSGRFKADSVNALQEAVAIAKDSDVAIMCMGQFSKMSKKESMEGEWIDRPSITLPSVQEELLKAVHATGTPMILVLLHGGPITSVWAEEHAAAIIDAWYPGQEGGTAIAEALMGDINPGGKMPLTVYRSDDDISHIEDYSMAGRTYRFFKGKPLYPFGFGLSYTDFAYDTLDVQMRDDGVYRVSVDVTNTGDRDGEEVVQVYVRSATPGADDPVHDLRGFKRVKVRRGDTRTVALRLDPAEWSRWDVEKDCWVAPAGDYVIEVGSSSADVRLEERLSLPL